MNSAKIIRSLRRKIPLFQYGCIPGCNDCCGPVAASRWELEQIGGAYINYDDPAKGGTFIDYSILPTFHLADIEVHPDIVESFHSVYGNPPVCQFYKQGIGCSVYEKRPIICQLYGTVDAGWILEKVKIFCCPYGCRPKKLLSMEKGATIWQEYMELIRKGK